MQRLKDKQQQLGQPPQLRQQQLVTSSSKDMRGLSGESSATPVKTKETTLTTVSTSKRKRKSKTEASQQISFSKKSKIAAAAALDNKGCTASDDLLAVPAADVPSSSLCGTMVLRECKVRARLLDIPPQILEQTTVKRSLLPYQIAKSLYRRGLPQVCVKYAKIVPPPRETVLELLQAAGDKHAAAAAAGERKKRPVAAKLVKFERKAGAGMVNGARKVECGGLERLIPVRSDFLGRNNPFHTGSTEAPRKGKGLYHSRKGWRTEHLLKVANIVFALFDTGVESLLYLHTIRIDHLPYPMF